ncbi:SDR family NAD(P)-dependent oxidoreductase [Colwellia asteriadis]|uniref:SDR family NAD(P)-dependent oxidoreductase n=1 Tax=Colwellia asteriadis TaxID=517723 RepID=A0ABN1LAM6_9GAMM
MMTEQTLILGANSGIAQAIAAKSLQQKSTCVTIVSRNSSAYQQLKKRHKNLNIINVENYSSTTMAKVAEQLTQQSSQPITRVYICHGILHNATVQPEKKLEDIAPDAFSAVMNANALTPMLWIKTLTPLLTGKTVCKLVVLSARVGSISDNRLGGWYSYRASKAALNMMLKNTAIEFARRAKNIKVIAFHPGTTDTDLSKPFQQNVPKGKLFTPEFVAKQLTSISDKALVDGQLSFVDWQAENISY